MYTPDSCKIIKIGIIGNTNFLQEFQNLFNENIITHIKISQNFNLNTEIMSIDNINNILFTGYNFIFYIINFDQLENLETISFIKKIGSQLTDPRNHLFVVVDQCNQMEIDDDGDLVFTSDTDDEIYHKFDKILDNELPEKLFHLFKLSSIFANIYHKIINDHSIVNLTEEEIDQLSNKHLKKSSKMSFLDKKREIKLILRKINLEDQLIETGYNEMIDVVNQYFKLIFQKKIVCQNYLFELNKEIIQDNNFIENIKIILNEIFDIKNFKTEMFNNFVLKITQIIETQLQNFFKKYKLNNSINSNQLNQANAYGHFLIEFNNILLNHDLIKSSKIIQDEINFINNIIIDHYHRELEKITDLEKISLILESFSTKDKASLILLFEKIKKHPKIIMENIEKMDKWIIFIDKSIELDVPKGTIIGLIEKIIMMKINYHGDITKTNKNDLSILYPYCLNIFLLTNLDHQNFLLKKLYMYLLYHLRYSGRNLSEFIQKLTHEQYQQLLILENKLLQLINQ